MFDVSTIHFRFFYQSRANKYICHIQYLKVKNTWTISWTNECFKEIKRFLKYILKYTFVFAENISV